MVYRLVAKTVSGRETRANLGASRNQSVYMLEDIEGKIFYCIPDANLLKFFEAQYKRSNVIEIKGICRLVYSEKNSLYNTIASLINFLRKHTDIVAEYEYKDIKDYVIVNKNTNVVANMFFVTRGGIKYTLEGSYSKFDMGFRICEVSADVKEPHIPCNICNMPIIWDNDVRCDFSSKYIEPTYTFNSNGARDYLFFQQYAQITAPITDLSTKEIELTGLGSLSIIDSFKIDSDKPGSYMIYLPKVHLLGSYIDRLVVDSFKFKSPNNLNNKNQAIYLVTDAISAKVYGLDSGWPVYKRFSSLKEVQSKQQTIINQGIHNQLLGLTNVQPKNLILYD